MNTRALTELPRTASVVIIGGGCTGLSAAYHLAKAGVRDVVLLERSYLSSGATGRCLGGVRAQFAGRDDIILARASQQRYESLGAELGFDPLFRQDGYLFLAFTDDELEYFRENARTQNELGVATRVLTPAEVKRRAPPLDTSRIAGAAYHARDGVAVHFALTWGLARAARRRGAQLHTFTEVRQLRAENGRVGRVETSRGNIETEWVINAAGGHARHFAAQLGVDLPIRTMKREAMVTESYKPFLDPFIVSLRGHAIFQTLRGEVVIEVSDPMAPETHEVGSTVRFLERSAREALRLMPCLADLRVIRQWAGWYDVSPDNRPILGPVEQVAGFLQASGYSGHGFMLAPVVGQILADLVTRGTTDLPIASFALSRFDGRSLTKETAVI